MTTTNMTERITFEDDRTSQLHQQSILFTMRNQPVGLDIFPDLYPGYHTNMANLRLALFGEQNEDGSYPDAMGQVIIQNAIIEARKDPDQIPAMLEEIRGFRAGIEPESVKEYFEKKSVKIAHFEELLAQEPPELYDQTEKDALEFEQRIRFSKYARISRGLKASFRQALGIDTLESENAATERLVDDLEVVEAAVQAKLSGQPIDKSNPIAKKIATIPTSQIEVLAQTLSGNTQLVGQEHNLNTNQTVETTKEDGSIDTNTVLGIGTHWMQF